MTVADAQAAANIDLRLTRGGVITGHVVDEDGEALARALVTVQRYQYVRGERQLTPAGGEQTDDRGQYRVFGLPPGDYYVSATAGGLAQMLGRGLQQLAAGIGGLAGGRGGPRWRTRWIRRRRRTGSDRLRADLLSRRRQRARGRKGHGRARPGSGRHRLPDPARPARHRQRDRRRRRRHRAGDARAAGRLGGHGPLGGQMLSGRTLADGTFSISNVPPGRYIAVARSGGARRRRRRRSEDRHAGDRRQRPEPRRRDAGACSRGVTLVGQHHRRVVGHAGAGRLLGLPHRRARREPLPFGGGGGPGGRGGGPAGGGRVEKNGAFQIGNLLPGRHYIRVTGGGQGAGQGQGRGGQTQAQGQWTLKSVLVAGQDVTDQAIEHQARTERRQRHVVLTRSLDRRSPAPCATRPARR